MRMRILLLRTWLTNIGNEFIEKGAKTCIEKAFPDSEVIEVSGFSNYVGYYKGLGIKNHLLDTLRGNKLKSENYKSTQQITFNISELIDDVDVAVLPGCILDKTLDMYMPTLEKIRENNIPLIFLGAGGSDYTPATQKHILEVIEKLKPNALITRDSMAYDAYSKYFSSSHSGIDCGFFVNEYYRPPKSKKTYMIATFDSSKEPKIISEYPIIRAYHEPLNYSYIQNVALRIAIESAENILKTSASKISKKNKVLISDVITDYLFLYSNAKEVHSDRVHACVAALSYGNRAKLYSNSPRSALFEKLLEEDITKKVVSLPEEKLNEEKSKQVRALKTSIENVL